MIYDISDCADVRSEGAGLDEWSDPVGYAAGQGHPDFPCLSRTHSPSSCVPCIDFSPWLQARIRAGSVEAVGEYLWRVREANPGVGESVGQFRQHYRALAEVMLAAPLDRYLTGNEAALLDLRTSLVMLAVHEGFSGFIMTGEAADFLSAVMSPHRMSLHDTRPMVARRNAFVNHMAGEMSYWAGWPTLTAEMLPSIAAPEDAEMQELLDRLALLPLGARAHAVDTLRHFSAETRVPRTLASLSRYETRKRGLDVSDSSRRIGGAGLVVPASDLSGWLAGWTRRDLLGFLAQAGLRPRNSWSKERLAEFAQTECEDLLRARMNDSGAIELAPELLPSARRLREHLDAARESWRVWLGFGTGIEG
ncbi:MAG TPA: hypothetical protein VEB59_02980 [Gemmatimonadales bacterium]|nr:hypothetical protein [Gemmatimonadales bacterium]